MKKVIQLLIVALFLSATSAFAQRTDVVGEWKTIDDETGKVKSVVEIYKEGNEYFGKIKKLFRAADEDQDPVCTKCSGEDKGKKIIGLVMVKNMEKDDDEWSGGTILDPKKGKTYTCKMWLEDGKLQVRGYVAFFFRTQEWLPYDGE
jgi:uncharacterized protein (DUF2147 family)